MSTSAADYEREGYEAKTWYLASCPYTQPKIRDAWQRGAWQWQQEQRANKSAAAPTVPMPKAPSKPRGKAKPKGASSLMIGDIVKYRGGNGGDSYVVTDIEGDRAKMRSIIGNNGESATLSDLIKAR